MRRPHSSTTLLPPARCSAKPAARPSRFRPALLAWSIAGAFTALPLALQANPTGGVAIQGQATFASQGNLLTVTTQNGAGTSHSAINWQSFSIPAGNTTNFIQPSAASTAINRVVTNTPSLIFGTLSSNGRLVLVNQSGITVGAGAVVDTAGFTASVLGMSEDDARAGRLRFNANGLGGASGALTVQGNIIARGGDVVLIAPSVEVAQTAVVEAQGGSVILAAGQQVEVTGRGLEGILLQVQAPSDSAFNLGTLKGDAVGIFASQLTHSGLIQATSATLDGGRVVLKAGDLAQITGTVQANSVSANGTVNGGSVSISGNAVQLSGDILARGQSGGQVTVQAGGSIIQTAAVDVSGVQGGGQVLFNAGSSLLQTAGASVRADATQGSGGSILLAAGAQSGTLFSSASISADGGGLGGGGGSIELLGSAIRLQAARVSASGDGAGGTVLVGGSAGGSDASVPNAQDLYVNATSAISASSRTQGQGGHVVLWSDGQTRFFGSIDATGAGAGQAGGLVEVSGKQGVQYAGQVSAAAGPGGAAGTLLLDPKNIIIGTSSSANGALSAIALADPNYEAGTLGSFGSYITGLGGNTVLVTDPTDNAGGSNAGAIYTFDKTTGALLSALTGSHANDSIGAGSPAYSGSSLVFQSTSWNSGAGAWTWIASTATSGPSGFVSASNSLVGTAAGDLNGAYLASGYTTNSVLVASNYAGGKGAVAAVGPGGLTGTLSTANALMGSTAGDHVGSGASNLWVYDATAEGYKLLLASPSWSSSAGALTAYDPTNPALGTLSSANSVVGQSAGDGVGSGITAYYSSNLYGFSNGAWLLFTPNWGGGKGAVTEFSGLSAMTGTVTADNSLVGGSAGDGGGFRFLNTSGATAYGYGYNTYSQLIVQNSSVNSAAGAITLIDPTQTVPVGTLSSANSLVGATAGDMIGSGGVTVTNTDGGLLINSPNWHGGLGGTIASAGALTFTTVSALAAMGGSGGAVVNGDNSLVGTAANDFYGFSLVNYGSYTSLASGYTLLVAPNYGGGISNGTGAVALLTLNGGESGPPRGILSASNALVGSTAGDHVGSGGVDTSQPSYWMIKSPSWNNGGTLANAGAVTFFEPEEGNFATGAVSGYSNSWVGGQAGDQIGANTALTIFSNDNGLLVSRNWGGGRGAITPIADLAMPYGTISSGNSYVGTQSTDGANMSVLSFDDSGDQYSSYPTHALISSQYWNGNRGFVTYINQDFSGLAPFGLISASNSLVGVASNDYLGSGGITVLAPAGEASAPTVIISSPGWSHGGTLASAGAYTFFNATLGAGTGTIGSANSIMGNSANALSSSTLYTNNNAGWVPAGQAVLVAPSYSSGAGALLMLNVADPTVGASLLSGAAPTDHLGSGGILVLNSSSTSSTFLLKSPSFASGAGALTYLDAANPTPFTLNAGASNSLVGSSSLDQLGGSQTQINQFSNNALLIVNGAGVGSITLVQNPATMAGTVSTANSLMGSQVGDLSGAAINFLTNSGQAYYNYGPYATQALVRMPSWSGATGAITLVDSTAESAPTGLIGAGNSLVGSAPGDRAGTNSPAYYGSYFVLNTPNWSNGGTVASAGALTFVTYGSGLPTGTLGSANSLVGLQSNDLAGYSINDLYASGNYALLAPNYNGGAGAAAILPGSGLSGTLSAANALVGSSSQDHVGSGGVYHLYGSNGYTDLVLSPSWSSATGAITFVDGNGNLPTGTLSSANSLVGSAAGDQIGLNLSANALTEFANGNLLLISRSWGGGKGAITLLAAGQTSGVISASNSLTGVTSSDGAGLTVLTLTTATGGVVGGGGQDSPLSLNACEGTCYGQSYTQSLVYNPYFNGGRGMVTYIDSSAASAPAGVISASNSLVGSTAGDYVGSGGISTYTNGGIVIASPNWNGSRGAITYMPQGSFTNGAVSSANSLVGVNAGDGVGSGGISAYYSAASSELNTPAAYYSVNSSYGNGAGAVTFLTPSSYTGTLSSANSLFGTATGTGYTQVQTDDATGLLQVRFSNGSGKVYYVDPTTAGNGSGGSGNLYADSPSSDVTITPQALASLAAGGTNVILQANNDIAVNAALALNFSSAASGAGMVLSAGRNVLVNADITLTNGSLVLLANASDALAAYRDGGTGGIGMGGGSTISLNGGSLLAEVDVGAGGGQPGGSITLGQISGAQDVFVNNLSSTAGAGIFQVAGTRWDVARLGLQTSAAGGDVGSLLQPISFTADGGQLAVKTASGSAYLSSTGRSLYLLSAGLSPSSLPAVVAPAPAPAPAPAAGPAVPQPDVSFRGIALGGNGSLRLATAGGLTLEAGGTPLGIVAGGSVVLNLGGPLVLRAIDQPVSIVAAQSLQITAAGPISLSGGSAAGAYALIDPTTPGSSMALQASSITLQGGSGAGAYAAISSPGGPLSLSTGSVTLNPGSGLDADAVILATNAQQLVASLGTACVGCRFLGIVSPLGNGVTDSGFAQTSLTQAQQSASNVLTGQNADWVQTFLALWTDEKKREGNDAGLSFEQTCR
jgi:filamentous hemagglutinin family protein